MLVEYVWLDGMPVAVASSIAFEPFGAVHAATGLDTGLRFPGQVYHWETSLHQNWMRDYDPSTGRYIQADPLGLVDGASVYGYVRQNPGRYTDPTGQCPLCWFAGVAIASALSDLAWQLYNLEPIGECDTPIPWYDRVNWYSVGASGAWGALGGAGVTGRIGKEVSFRAFGNNWRFAPFGNATGHRYGRFPHYHRSRGTPNQGIRRHRPLEPRSGDSSIWDRF